MLSDIDGEELEEVESRLYSQIHYTNESTETHETDTNVPQTTPLQYPRRRYFKRTPNRRASSYGTKTLLLITPQNTDQNVPPKNVLPCDQNIPPTTQEGIDRHVPDELHNSNRAELENSGGENQCEVDVAGLNVCAQENPCSDGKLDEYIQLNENSADSAASTDFQINPLCSTVNLNINKHLLESNQNANKVRKQSPFMGFYSSKPIVNKKNIRKQPNNRNDDTEQRNRILKAVNDAELFRSLSQEDRKKVYKIEKRQRDRERRKLRKLEKERRLVEERTKSIPQNDPIFMDRVLAFWNRNQNRNIVQPQNSASDFRINNFSPQLFGLPVDEVISLSGSDGSSCVAVDLEDEVVIISDSDSDLNTSKSNLNEGLKEHVDGNKSTENNDELEVKPESNENSVVGLNDEVIFVEETKDTIIDLDPETCSPPAQLLVSENQLRDSELMKPPDFESLSVCSMSSNNQSFGASTSKTTPKKTKPPTKDCNESASSNQHLKSKLTPKKVAQERDELLSTPESNDFLETTLSAEQNFNFSLHGADFDISKSTPNKKTFADICESESSCSASDISAPVKAIGFNEIEFDSPSKELFSENNMDSFSDFITPKRSSASLQIAPLLTPARDMFEQVQARALRRSVSEDEDSSSSESDYDESDYDEGDYDEGDYDEGKAGQARVTKNLPELSHFEIDKSANKKEESESLKKEKSVKEKNKRVKPLLSLDFDNISDDDNNIEEVNKKKRGQSTPKRSKNIEENVCEDTNIEEINKKKKGESTPKKFLNKNIEEHLCDDNNKEEISKKKKRESTPKRCIDKNIEKHSCEYTNKKETKKKKTPKCTSNKNLEDFDNCGEMKKRSESTPKQNINKSFEDSDISKNKKKNKDEESSSPSKKTKKKKKICDQWIEENDDDTDHNESTTTNISGYMEFDETHSEFGILNKSKMKKGGKESNTEEFAEEENITPSEHEGETSKNLEGPEKSEGKKNRRTSDKRNPEKETCENPEEKEKSEGKRKRRTTDKRNPEETETSNNEEIVENISRMSTKSHEETKSNEDVIEGQEHNKRKRKSNHGETEPAESIEKSIEEREKDVVKRRKKSPSSNNRNTNLDESKNNEELNENIDEQEKATECCKKKSSSNNKEAENDVTTSENIEEQNKTSEGKRKRKSSENRLDSATKNIVEEIAEIDISRNKELDTNTMIEEYAETNEDNSVANNENITPEVEHELETENVVKDSDSDIELIEKTPEIIDVEDSDDDSVKDSSDDNVEDSNDHNDKYSNEEGECSVETTSSSGFECADLENMGEVDLANLVTNKKKVGGRKRKTRGEKPKRCSDLMMRVDMNEFYKNSFGAEKLDVEDLQKDMSDNPNDWKILESDRVRVPSDKEKRPRCRKCRQVGHIAMNCTEKSGPSICSLCGEKGHLEPRCRNKVCTQCGRPCFESTVFCSKCAYLKDHTCEICKMQGHEKKNCPDLWRRYHLTCGQSCFETTVFCSKCAHVKYFKCNVCKLLGHRKHLCPDIWRRYHLTVDEGRIFRPKLPSRLKPKRSQWCSGCGKNGHLEHECRYLIRTHPPALPRIVDYRELYGFKVNKKSTKAQKSPDHRNKRTENQTLKRKSPSDDNQEHQLDFERNAGKSVENIVIQEYQTLNSRIHGNNVNIESPVQNTIPTTELSPSVNAGRSIEYKAPISAKLGFKHIPELKSSGNECIVFTKFETVRLKNNKGEAFFHELRKKFRLPLELVESKKLRLYCVWLPATKNICSQIKEHLMEFLYGNQKINNKDLLIKLRQYLGVLAALYFNYEEPSVVLERIKNAINRDLKDYVKLNALLFGLHGLGKGHSYRYLLITLFAKFTPCMTKRNLDLPGDKAIRRAFKAVFLKKFRISQYQQWLLMLRQQSKTPQCILKENFELKKSNTEDNSVSRVESTSSSTELNVGPTPLKSTTKELRKLNVQSKFESTSSTNGSLEISEKSASLERRDKPASLETRKKSASLETRDKPASLETREKSASLETREKPASCTVTENLESIGKAKVAESSESTPKSDSKENPELRKSGVEGSIIAEVESTSFLKENLESRETNVVGTSESRLESSGSCTSKENAALQKTNVEGSQESRFQSTSSCISKENAALQKTNVEGSQESRFQSTSSGTSKENAALQKMNVEGSAESRFQSTSSCTSEENAALRKTNVEGHQESRFQSTSSCTSKENAVLQKTDVEGSKAKENAALRKTNVEGNQKSRFQSTSSGTSKENLESRKKSSSSCISKEKLASAKENFESTGSSSCSKQNLELTNPSNFYTFKQSVASTPEFLSLNVGANTYTETIHFPKCHDMNQIFYDYKSRLNKLVNVSCTNDRFVLTGAENQVKDCVKWLRVFLANYSKIAKFPRKVQISYEECVNTIALINVWAYTKSPSKIYADILKLEKGDLTKAANCKKIGDLYVQLNAILYGKYQIENGKNVLPMLLDDVQKLRFVQGGKLTEKMRKALIKNLFYIFDFSHKGIAYEKHLDKFCKQDSVGCRADWFLKHELSRFFRLAKARDDYVQMKEIKLYFKFIAKSKNLSGVAKYVQYLEKTYS